MPDKFNEQLYEDARRAITKLFEDINVAQTQTIENLQTLIEEIKTMIDSLEKGIEEEEG